MLFSDGDWDGGQLLNSFSSSVGTLEWTDIEKKKAFNVLKIYGSLKKSY